LKDRTGHTTTEHLVYDDEAGKAMVDSAMDQIAEMRHDIPRVQEFLKVLESWNAKPKDELYNASVLQLAILDFHQVSHTPVLTLYKLQREVLERATSSELNKAVEVVQTIISK